MGFVGGCGNIGFATTLPPLFCVLYCLNIHTVYWLQLYNLLSMPETSVSGCGD